MFLKFYFFLLLIKNTRLCLFIGFYYIWVKLDGFKEIQEGGSAVY